MKSPQKPALPSDKTYTISFSTQAAKQFKKFAPSVAQKLKDEIAKLAANPRPTGVVKLTNREGYRIRVGDYRILYSIFDKSLLIEILKVGQRGNLYEN